MGLMMGDTFHVATFKDGHLNDHLRTRSVVDVCEHIRAHYRDVVGLDEAAATDEMVAIVNTCKTNGGYASCRDGNGIGVVMATSESVFIRTVTASRGFVSPYTSPPLARAVAESNAWIQPC